MESHELFDVFAGEMCAGCGGRKRRLVAFCPSCYRELPKALKNALWQRFGHGMEEAYHACLSWFRVHPLQGAHRAHQRGLFDQET
jgi:predicted amidophosphoribosyltransferase